MGWVLDSTFSAEVRRKFRTPAWGKGKSSCACTCVCGYSHCTCSLWLGVVGKIEKFCTWFEEVNAATQDVTAFVDLEADDGGAADVGEDEDELMSEEDGAAAAAEQKKIDDDPEIREKTMEGTVTLK